MAVKEESMLLLISSVLRGLSTVLPTCSTRQGAFKEVLLLYTVTVTHSLLMYIYVAWHCVVEDSLDPRFVT